MPTILPAVLAVGVLTLAVPAKAQDDVAPLSALDRKSSSALPAPEARVLVDGDGAQLPPLTEAMVERVATFVTYCFEIPLTPADRDHFRAVLVGEWQRKDRAAIAGDLQMVKAAEELAKLDPLKRELFRQSTLAAGLADARKRAKNDPDMRWLVSRYEQEHRPLAPGKPALTRQATDAFAALACFMAGEARGGGQTMEPNKEFKDTVARLLVKQWPSLNAEGRNQLAGMPLTLAQLRAAWPEAPEAQKEQIRAQWRQQFGMGQQASSGQVAQAGKAGTKGNRTKELYDRAGGQALSNWLTSQSNKHIGNMMILSNPAFYR